MTKHSIIRIVLVGLAAGCVTLSAPAQAAWGGGYHGGWSGGIHAGFGFRSYRSGWGGWHGGNGYGWGRPGWGYRGGYGFRGYGYGIGYGYGAYYAPVLAYGAVGYAPPVYASVAVPAYRVGYHHHYHHIVHPVCR